MKTMTNSKLSGGVIPNFYNQHAHGYNDVHILPIDFKEVIDPIREEPYHSYDISGTFIINKNESIGHVEILEGNYIYVYKWIFAHSQNSFLQSTDYRIDEEPDDIETLYMFKVRDDGESIINRNIYSISNFRWAPSADWSKPLQSISYDVNPQLDLEQEINVYGENALRDAYAVDYLNIEGLPRANGHYIHDTYSNRLLFSNDTMTQHDEILDFVRKLYIVSIINARMCKELSMTHIGMPDDGMFIVGDLHGDLPSLFISLQLYIDVLRTNPDTNIIFLGDYTDRGLNSLEILDIITTLKLFYPKRVYLGRGNHEDFNVNLNFTGCNLPQSIASLFININENEYRLIMNAIGLFYYSLPVLHIADDKFIFVHGFPGIKTNITTASIKSAAERLHSRNGYNNLKEEYEAKNIPDYAWVDTAVESHSILEPDYVMTYSPIAGDINYRKLKPIYNEDSEEHLSMWSDFPFNKHNMNTDYVVSRTLLDLLYDGMGYKRIIRGHDHAAASCSINTERIKVDTIISSLLANREVMLSNTASSYIKTDHRFIDTAYENGTFTFYTTCAHLSKNGKLKKYSFEQYANDKNIMHYVFTNMRGYYLKRWNRIPITYPKKYNERTTDVRIYLPIDVVSLYYIDLLSYNVDVYGTENSSEILDTLCAVLNYDLNASIRMPSVTSLLLPIIKQKDRDVLDRNYMSNNITRGFNHLDRKHRISIGDMSTTYNIINSYKDLLLLIKYYNVKYVNAVIDKCSDEERMILSQDLNYDSVIDKFSRREIRAFDELEPTSGKSQIRLSNINLSMLSPTRITSIQPPFSPRIIIPPPPMPPADIRNLPPPPTTSMRNPPSVIRKGRFTIIPSTKDNAQ